MGCRTSVDALFQLKADFRLTDNQGLSAIDIMNQHGHARCYAVATGQQKAEALPPRATPSPTLSRPPGELLYLLLFAYMYIEDQSSCGYCCHLYIFLLAGRSLSNAGAASPKVGGLHDNPQ